MDDFNKLLSRALRVASEAAREAGKLIVREHPSIRPEDVAEKGPRDLVTRVDKASETLILERIRAEFPGDAILSEESGGGRTGDEFLWVVDPLDGTRNYVQRLPHYGVSIAYALRGLVEVGVIYDPVHDELFTCKRNEGVWLNGAPIGVSNGADLGKAFIATGFPSRYRDDADGYLAQFSAVSKSSAGVRRCGAAALDLAHVACGRYDAYWEPRLAPWDMAAGGLMVDVAGGIVTDVSGGEWRLEGDGILAAAPDLHRPLASLLAATRAAVRAKV